MRRLGWCHTVQELGSVSPFSILMSVLWGWGGSGLGPAAPLAARTLAARKGGEAHSRRAPCPPRLRQAPPCARLHVCGRGGQGRCTQGAPHPPPSWDAPTAAARATAPCWQGHLLAGWDNPPPGLPLTQAELLAEVHQLRRLSTGVGEGGAHQLVYQLVLA